MMLGIKTPEWSTGQPIGNNKLIRSPRSIKKPKNGRKILGFFLRLEIFIQSSSSDSFYPQNQSSVVISKDWKVSSITAYSLVSLAPMDFSTYQSEGHVANRPYEFRNELYRFPFDS